MMFAHALGKHWLGCEADSNAKDADFSTAMLLVNHLLQLRRRMACFVVNSLCAGLQ